MSGTAFLQIVAAVAALLSALPALAGVPVYRNRVHPIARDESRAISVRLASSQRLTDAPLAAQDWQTTLEVECAARAASGAADPAAAVDGLLGAAWSALAAPSAVALGVIDIDSDPEIAWDFEAADTPIASAILRLVVRHRTQADTLTPWS